MGLPFRLVRSMLFRLPPDEAHELVLRAAEAAGRRRWVRRLLSWCYRNEWPTLATRCMGTDFSSPLGLAAGFDPDARAVTTLASLGFGHLEVGSVLPSPWAGPPAPRMLRPSGLTGLVHRQGGPSAGVLAVARALGRAYPGAPLGVNVAGRGLLPGETEADLVGDLTATCIALAPVATYLTLSTCLPGLARRRGLESPELLGELVSGVVARLPAPRPRVLVKLAGDLPLEVLEELAGAALAAGADGLVQGGARRDLAELPEGVRERLAALRPELPEAAFSGPDLLEGTVVRVRHLREIFGPRPVLVACGGIFTGADVLRVVRAGADLVQILTALVWRGPAAPSLICRELAHELHRAGVRTLTALRGQDL